MGESLYWQIRIQITQKPEKFEQEIVPETDIPNYLRPKDVRSFLFDPIGKNPLITFGLEIIADSNIKWTFFTRVGSESEGIEMGKSWLTLLKNRFKGLDGFVEVVPIINKPENHKAPNLKEIKIPGILRPMRIEIIEDFIKLFYYLKGYNVQLYLLWQRNQSNQDNLGSAVYKLRVFMNYEFKFASKKEQLELDGVLNSIFLNIEDDRGKRASITNSLKCSLFDILNCEVFKGDLNNQATVNEYEINFDFPEDVPLPKLPVLDSEIIKYNELSTQYMENMITIGKHIKNGVISAHTTHLPINIFTQDCVIFGKSGSGKTYFLARLIEELQEKAKDVGILVLNVAKESQDVFYKEFQKIKYSDDIFHIPYFTKGDKLSSKKQIQETATYICASLGLKNVFEKIIYRTMIGFRKLEGKLPDTFYGLLQGVEIYMENNSYGPEEQANLMQAFRNRMNVFEEKKVQNVLRLTKNIPDWISKWMRGKNIFLDLSMCSKFVKLLIVNAIFQLVRTITKDSEVEKLKYLIVIDEAHAILEKPITQNSDDADFIMKEQMAKIFSEVLKEYRSRGVGFVIADQSPDRLFDDVGSQPSIKILFRMDYPNNLLFSENPNERQMLTQLENRLVLVNSGATGEKYLIITLNYVLDF